MTDQGSNQKTKRKSLKNIKSGLISRSLSLAKLTVGAGASLAGRKVKSFLQNNSTDSEKKQELWRSFLQDQARTWADELGELKGSLMKAGQMLSILGEHFLPPEVNQSLKTLQNDSPPVDWDRMKKILEKQLPLEALEEIEIEEQALASASLGQVHRARIKATGQSIVLKIQYPGVDRAIESDIKAIRQFLNLLKIAPIEGSLEPVLSELKEMLRQETDYEYEVQLMARYRSLLKDDPRFIIPQFIPRYSSQKVIAMSFERGLKADDPLVQALPQERRNRLALNFLELYFKEIFEWRFLQTDPHLGNYRLRLDPGGTDRIVLFDFGATKEFNAAFMAKYKLLVKNLVVNQEQVKQTCLDFGFIKPDDDPKLVELFISLSFETVEPFEGGVYDWKKTDLPQRITQGAFKLAQGYPLRTPPQEFLFLNRKTAGVFIFLSVLGAQINSRDLILKYLNRAD